MLYIDWILYVPKQLQFVIEENETVEMISGRNHATIHLPRTAHCAHSPPEVLLLRGRLCEEAPEADQLQYGPPD